MRDLSVTDVQKHLRNMAAYGHDVITNPDMVHLEGKPYSMAIGHHLVLSGEDPGEEKHGNLMSYLLQQERPLVSRISTMETSLTPEVWSSVRPMYREIWKGKSTYTTKEDVNSSMDWITAPGEYHSPEWHNGVKNRHADMHEALKAHTSRDFPMYEDYQQFNDKEAFNNLIVGLTPFRGLVKVVHAPVSAPVKYKSYTYDPRTEMLLKDKE